MKTEIIALRNKGKLLSNEQFVKRVGRLQMLVGHRGVFVAHFINLQDNISEVLPLIYDARVVKIESRGMLIAGIEHVRRGKKEVERYPQTWWCTEWVPPGAVPFSPGYNEYRKYLALHLPWLEAQAAARSKR